MAHIFISHVEEDADVAIAIADVLEAAGFSTWYYERDGTPGAKYLVEVGEQIDEAKAVLLLISVGALASNQVTVEVARAHESRKPFIPVLRGISDEMYKRRQPEWRAAIGTTVSVPWPEAGADEDILRRLIRGATQLCGESANEASPQTEVAVAPARARQCTKLSDREKRAFWGHVLRQGTARIVTGSIHNTNLNIECVDEWHMRTVSALACHLPLVRDPVNVQVASPIYSPEHACTLASPCWRDEDRQSFLRGFDDSVAAELTGCNPIVIGSADTNYATEYVLRSVCHLDIEDTFASDWPPVFGYVATTQEFDPGCPTGEFAESTYRRLFYEVHLAQDTHADRGFREYYNGHPVNVLMEEYKSQCASEAFRILGHLLIAKWPVAPDSENVVVVLDGPGVATYALAELLTGGDTQTTERSSEELLVEVNQLLTSPDWEAIEAIVEIDVAPCTDRPSRHKDDRTVMGWRYVVPPRPVRRP